MMRIFYKWAVRTAAKLAEQTIFILCLAHVTEICTTKAGVINLTGYICLGAYYRPLICLLLLNSFVVF